jgi:dienelactone hydrolase
MTSKILLGLALAIIAAAGLTGARAEPSRVTTEPLTFDTNTANNVKRAKIKATLYLPGRATPAPAMVIINSSGGVLDWIEGYYARELGKAGIAALVVDSYGPRGVRRTVEDQSLVSSWDMENDAFAALALLRKDKRIDAAHIGIMGVSKGGLVALNAALMVRRDWRGTGDLAFALHVPIVPGCEFQHRDVSTTGRPVLVMLAERDDYNFASDCADYARRMVNAGNPAVTVKIYKGAQHNWETMGEVIYMARAENYSRCKGSIEADGAITMAVKDGPRLMKSADVFAYLRTHCMTMGVHVGGGTEKLRGEATADLMRFLKGHGF